MIRKQEASNRGEMTVTDLSGDLTTRAKSSKRTTLEFRANFLTLQNNSFLFACTLFPCPMLICIPTLYGSGRKLIRLELRLRCLSSTWLGYHPPKRVQMRLIPNPEKHLGDPQMRIFSFLMEPLKYQDHASVFKERVRRGTGLKGRQRIGVREGCYARSNGSNC